MQIVPKHVPGVFQVFTDRHVDSRGFFCELFRLDQLRQLTGQAEFPQENLSFSTRAGTVRGLHFQTEPAAQGKLIRCVRGAIFDVAVDIRVGSPTYGTHVATELSHEDGSWLWIPVGFAHGFCTLEPETEVIYKVTQYYSDTCEHGIFWNDPTLQIEWPISGEAAIVSEKDLSQPLFENLQVFFRYAL